MEDLFLGLVLVGDELDVIDEPYVDVPVHASELFDAVGLEGVDEVFGKLLGGDVGDVDLRVVIDQLASNCVEEVRLAETAVSVDEEWVELDARLGGDGD